MELKKSVVVQRMSFIHKMLHLRNGPQLFIWMLVMVAIAPYCWLIFFYGQEKFLCSSSGAVSAGLSPESGSKRIRLLCWVLTNSRTQQDKAPAIRDTWGKRCDKLIFMSSVENEELGAININVPEGPQYMYGKSRNALKYFYDHHLNDYDWFLKADDDTYVIVENLRYLLSLYDPDFPLALGGRFHRSGRMNYLSGQGSALSRAGVKKYAEISFPNASLCRDSHLGQDEDVEIGRCLTNAGVLLGDSRDEFHRKRFHQIQPEQYITGDHLSRFPSIVPYEQKSGLEAFSNTTIIFHKLKNHATLYIYEFLIYELQVFGLNREFRGSAIPSLPPDISVVPEEVLKRYGHPDMKAANTTIKAVFS